MKEEAGYIIAMDEAKARAQAVVDLMKAADQQAATLLGIYLAATAATTTGAAAAIVAGATYWLIAATLIAVTAVLIIASIFCLLVMRKVPIANPGSEPAFWLWAIENDGVSFEMAVTTHLQRIQADIAFNRRINARSSWYLSVAKILATAIPIVGAGTAAATWLCFPAILAVA